MYSGMNTRTYNPNVRLGNWQEELVLKEDTLKEFLEKREKGELSIQKSAAFFGTYGQTIALSVSVDGKVHFSDHVVLVNCGDDERPTSVLSYLGTDGCVEYTVTASCCTKPVTRNVFIVTSVDGSDKTDALNYGEPFYLCTQSREWFLCSDRATWQNSAKRSRHNLVTFVKTPSHLCEWRVDAFNPQLRVEMENSPVEANQKACIAHVKTNQNLNLEPDYRVRTLFGREFEISACTRLDTHKAELNTNHWMMVMHVPGDSKYPTSLL